MKKLIILPLILALFISTLAISGQYDSYKPDYRSSRWDIKINAFIDQASALYDYCHTTLTRPRTWACPAPGRTYR